MAGNCVNATQCLLHLQGNASYDGDVSRWFRLSDPKLWPRCVNSSQNILDYLCENGNWTTRTKHVALQFLQVAEAAQDDFTLFCDRYERVLNRFSYRLQGVPVENYLGRNCPSEGGLIPCVNSLCVLATPAAIAVGTTLNAPVGDTLHSFLRALGKSAALCNTVNPNATVFTSCGENTWYNPAIQAVIYLPAALTPLAPQSAAAARLSAPMGAMSSYVTSVLHNPRTEGRDFSFFPRTHLFNHVYVAQKGTRAIFGFLEEGIRPELNPIPLDYIGVRYAGIDIGTDPCRSLIKVYDDQAFCENQTSPMAGFNVIARHRDTPSGLGASPIVEVWPALTGKLRP